MTKQNYLDELENCLQNINQTQRKEILSDIEEYFDMSAQNGRGEQEIIASLGFPSALARQYREEGVSGEDLLMKNRISTGDAEAAYAATFSAAGTEEINASINAARFSIIPVHKNTDEIKVEITGKATDAYRVYMSGSTLYITETEGYSLLKFFRDRDIRIKLYLPDHYKNNFFINMKSGKIDFEQLNCKKFTLKLSSGSVTGEGVTADSIASNIMSGNLAVGRYVARMLEFKVASGNIRVDKIEVPSFEMSVSSGSIKLGEVLALSSNIKCSSGVFHIESMSGDMAAKMSSGTMKINYRVLPEKMDITTTSGVAKISLPPGSVIDLQQQHTSGRISCAAAVSRGAPCMVNAKVTSGIVKIY